MRIFCKRSLRRLLIFLLLLAAPVLAAQLSKSETPPPCGFYMAETTPVTQRIEAHLLQNGFIACPDPEAIAQQVRWGELDCGIVFPQDFSQKVVQGQLKESITVYVSPVSFAPMLYKSHVAAAVFREYVPYICASAFEGTQVTQEAVLAEYEAMFAQGYAFSFDVLPLSGKPDTQAGKNRSLSLGAAAITLFAFLFALAAETAQRAVTQLLPRLGLRKTVTAVLLPETGITLLLAAIFGGGGLALAGFPELMLPTAVYCVAVWGLGLIAYSILWSAKKLYVLLPVLVIAAAALCPIYTDLALVLPWLERVRSVIPAYWLWCIPEQQGLWGVIATVVLAAGVSLIVLRCRTLLKFKI